MVSRSPNPGDETSPTAIKILIAGGFGTGKSSLVSTISEIKPLRTEETLSAESVPVDDLTGIEDKSSTTVALDFGRITIDSEIVLYLFGTPGQSRFWYMWNDLAIGTMGAIVLLDTRRPDTSFSAIDFFEHRNIPFILVVNRFPDSDDYDDDEIRTAFDLTPEVPILTDCSALEFESCKTALITLQEYIIRKTEARVGVNVS